MRVEACDSCRQIRCVDELFTVYPNERVGYDANTDSKRDLGAGFYLQKRTDVRSFPQQNMAVYCETCAKRVVSYKQKEVFSTKGSVNHEVMGKEGQ